MLSRHVRDTVPLWVPHGSADSSPCSVLGCIPAGAFLLTGALEAKALARKPVVLNVAAMPGARTVLGVALANGVLWTRA